MRAVLLSALLLPFALSAAPVLAEEAAPRRRNCV